MRSIFALSIHADYRCHRSGVCCSSDWDVPAELSVFRSVSDALRAGRLHVESASADGGPPLIQEDGLPDGAAAMIARTPTGHCVFYDRPSGLCAVHRDLGEPHLPATCRHFPRLAVRDRRGTFISLTHYCPTAASMLFRGDVELSIVSDPPAFPPADYEGLMVDPDAWPPLLRPRMLMDLESYAAWERHMVHRCATADVSPEAVVATLTRDAKVLRAFRPGRCSLVDEIGALPADVVDGERHRSLERSLIDFTEACTAVPDDLKPEPDEDQLADAYAQLVAPGWGRWHVPLKRYVAAKAFASWTAYQGQGVLTIVRGIEAALSLVRVEASRQCRDAGRPLDADLLREAIRRADFLLNHLAVGEDLAVSWSRVESWQEGAATPAGTRGPEIP